MKKILIVVDYQKDFVDGALGFDGAERLDEGIAEKISSYPHGCVFYTLDTHGEDYMQTREGKNLPIPHCIENTEGHAVYGKTAVALEKAGAVGFKKHSFGLDITRENLERLPKPDEVESVELVGLVSNICVISNAIIFQTLYPQAEIIVDASLTDSADKEVNRKAVDVMEGLQVKVSGK